MKKKYPVSEIPESKFTFVVIGAGATGVETVAQLHELIHEVVGPEYPNINPNRFRVFLLDALPNILPDCCVRIIRGSLGNASGSFSRVAGEGSPWTCSNCAVDWSTTTAHM